MLFAEIRQPTGAPIVGVVTGEVVTESGAMIGQARFFDDGTGADEAAGDGRYTAAVDLALRSAAARAIQALVRITATTAESGSTLHATTGFQISRPGAMLTGRFTDRVADGHLVIAAEVAVRRPGRYHLAAVVTAADGMPIGRVQAAARLATGRHELELEAYGLLIRDRGIAGPYR